jgi:hypothetical protein
MFIDADCRDAKDIVLLFVLLKLASDLALKYETEPEVLVYRQLVNAGIAFSTKGIGYLANECDVIAPQLRQSLSIDY